MNALSSIFSLIDYRRWRYGWKYLCGQTPWVTGQTPSEVVAFIKSNPPGKALDVGCGTGTHAFTLARYGWEVMGVDFVPHAIRKACKRAAHHDLPVTFSRADITRPLDLGHRFDFALDIGCLFGLSDKGRECYAGNLARLLKPGAWYMLYAWLPWIKNGTPRGISPEAVENLFRDRFCRCRMDVVEEKGRAAAWYWYRRK